MAIYKFKSKATGDVIMMAETADRLLRAVGKEPSAKGIFEVAALPAAVQAVEAAIAADDTARAAAEREAAAEGRHLPPRDIGLRQRAWPLVEMMKRSHAEGHAIVWGV